MKLTLATQKGWLLPVFCLIQCLAFGQDSLNGPPLYAAIKMHYGFYMANKPKSVYLRDSYSTFGEISVGIQTRGSAWWQQANGYPRAGIAAFYGNTGSRQYIGHMAGLFPYVNFPLLRTRPLRVGFRLGTGIAWVEKPFDVENNPKNLMLSTHINACISMLLEAEVNIAQHIAVNGGLSFTHISNGLYQMPNLGLNMPALSLGVRYSIGKPVAYQKQLPPVINHSLHWQVFAATAVKQGNWLLSRHYVLGIINAEAMFTKKRGNEWGLGLMVTYDPSLSKEIANAPVLTHDNSKPKYQAGIYGTYEHNLGRVSIPLQLGAYLYNQYSINPLFQVIGVRYAINKHWKAAFQLKTHLGKADHIDWGIGYRF